MLYQQKTNLKEHQGKLSRAWGRRPAMQIKGQWIKNNIFLGVIDVIQIFVELIPCAL